MQSCRRSGSCACAFAIWRKMGVHLFMLNFSLHFSMLTPQTKSRLRLMGKPNCLEHVTHIRALYLFSCVLMTFFTFRSVSFRKGCSMMNKHGSVALMNFVEESSVFELMPSPDTSRSTTKSFGAWVLQTLLSWHSKPTVYICGHRIA